MPGEIRRTLGTICIALLIGACGGTDTHNPPSEDLAKPGPFKAGFQFIQYVDTTRETDTGGRPLPVFLFYPVDPTSVTAATPLASYPLDPVSGALPQVSASEYV